MPLIHPTAVIEPGAEVADDATVGPFCHVGARARIGAGCRLISHVCVFGRTTLGSHNTVWPHAVLGGDPQDLKFRGEDTELIIGDHNDIRECVTIHKGTDADEGVTRVGDHNLLMAYVHVGHDSIIGSHCVIANTVQLAGHVLIEDHANIGGATALHHFVTVSQYAFVGGMSRITHDVPPFLVVEGNPARPRKVNTMLLKRHDFPDEQVHHLKRAFRLLYGTGEDDSFTGNSARHLDELDERYPDDWCIQRLVQTLRRSAAGTYGRHREAARRDNRYTNPVR